MALLPGEPIVGLYPGKEPCSNPSEAQTESLQDKGPRQQDPKVWESLRRDFEALADAELRGESEQQAS